MSNANELNARLFLEGRSVPFIGATVEAKMGQPTVANIEMVPLREINDISPRSMVHLFVKDYTYPTNPKPWILLFEGEVYGFGMEKKSDHRAFNIHAMDISNYWDNAKQYYMNGRTSSGDLVQTLTFAKAVEEAKAENAQVKRTVTGIRAFLTRLLTNKLKSGGDFLEAIIEILKGVEEVNPFFRYADARYRLNERILFKSSNSLGELFDVNNRENLWDSLSGKGNGGMVTIRSVVNLLMDMIFHDFVSIPAPSKVEIDGLKTGIGPKANKTVGSFAFKPNSFMLPPPRCNILFPDQYDALYYNRTFFHEVTRTKLKPNLTSVQKTDNSFEAFLTTYYTPKGFDSYRTKGVASEVSGTQHHGPTGQGNHGTTATEEIKTHTVLQDYNFLSYEEILKGIFSDQGNIVPSAQMVSQTTKIKDQKKFFQRASDFIFAKKRFASRVSNTSGPFNPAPVPGFTMLLLDDSAAEQHTLGTLDSVVHRISASGGAYTQYTLSYSRYIEEKDLWDGTLAEPAIPPWFDKSIYGENRPIKSSDYEHFISSVQTRMKGLANVNDFGTKINASYLNLLGSTNSRTHLGSLSLTTDRHPSVLGATFSLLDQYRRKKKDGKEQDFVNLQTRRDYVELEEMFQFLGADARKVRSKIQQDAEDIVFKGTVFDGGFVNDDIANKPSDRDKKLKSLFGTEATKLRRAPIDAYRKRLLNERGFRG